MLIHVVGDPPQAGREHVEEGCDSRQQKDRGQGDLNDMGDRFGMCERRERARQEASVDLIQCLRP